MKAGKIKEIVTRKLSGKLSKVSQVYTPDPKYYTPTKKEVKDILKKTKIDRLNYKKMSFDCDDFALELKAKFAREAHDDKGRNKPYAFGIIWGKLKVGNSWGGHAINWFIDNKNRLWLVEPQTDEIFKPTDKEVNEVWFLYM